MWYSSQRKEEKYYPKTGEKKIAQIFHELAKQKECEILEGSTMSDHVHNVPLHSSQTAVSSIIGFLKGKVHCGGQKCSAAGKGISNGRALLG